MRFTVPQFIEHEAKIVGPLTIKQFLFFGIAGAISLILFLTLGKENFFLFILISAFLFGGAFVLAFFKVEGRSLPTFLGYILKFSLMPKIYIWRKREIPLKIFKKEIRKEKMEEGVSLKITEKSRLKKLSTQMVTKVQ